MLIQMETIKVSSISARTSEKWNKNRNASIAMEKSFEVIWGKIYQKADSSRSCLLLS